MPERVADPPVPPVLAADDRVTLPRPAPPRRTVPPDTRPPTPRGLRRPRLLAAVDRALDVRICAVVAPAGSGKTTVLAHWVDRAAVDTVWWRAEPGEDDPVTRVLAGVGAAVRAVDPRLPPTPTVADLALALDGRGGPVAVVVDDLQHVASDPVGSLLEQLLLATRDRVHLVLGSRTPPPLNLARGELTSVVLGPSDLRFRPAEVAELFRTEYDVPLSWEQAGDLARRTDGLAAALRLCDHAIGHGEPRSRRRAAAATGDRARFARDYLHRTFLAGLSTDERAFLRDTAAFETLTGERCDLLLDRLGSAETLDRLARRGIVTPVEDGAGHALPRVLRDHLLTSTRSGLGPRVVAARFRAAARILTDEAGDSATVAAPAVRAWVAGGAWPDALVLLAEHWAAVIDDADLSWVGSAPVEVAGHPLLRVVRAELACRDGRLAEALDLLDAGPVPAEPGPAATAAALRRACRTWTAGDLQPGAAWGELLRVAVRRPDPDRRTSLPREERVVLAAAEALVLGDLGAARDLLDPVVDRIAAPVLACAAELVAAVLAPHDARRAESVALQADYAGIPWFARLAGALDHGRHDPELLAAEVGAADQRGDAWGALLLAATGAATALLDGSAGVRELDDLARRARALDAPALEAWARSGAALASVAARLPDAARDAESAVGFAHSAQVPGALAYARLALGRCRGDQELRRGAEADLARLGLPLPQDRGPVEEHPAVVDEGAECPLDVRCFGGFELRVRGAVPDLHGVRPRARALLRLLALHAGQPVHREVIAEAMWPQLDGAAALHNLHVSVSGLRTALEPGVARGASRLVVRDGDRYLLALPPGSVSDLREFDRLTAAADAAHAAGEVDAAIDALRAAVTLYSGEVLPEDGPTEWVLPHREHYQGRAAEAAARLGRLHLEQRRPDDAAAAARRSIGIDACRDGSWRLLVAAHEAAGNHAGAEEARRSYADVLESLGVATRAATAAVSVGRGC